MKKRTLLLCLVLVFTGAGILTGCKTYLHFRYGLTRPAEESPASLREFLAKGLYPSGGQYLFRDSAAFGWAARNANFRKYLFSHMIFDRDGVLLQRDTTQCQWWGFDRIAALEPGGDYEKSTDVRLDEILPEIIPLTPDSTASADPDFTVVVLWAKFLGRYNSRLFVLGKAAEMNKKARIRVIWLNTDMQQEWHLRDGQKMGFR